MPVPSERSAFHAPSQEQLELANQLGVSVPAGISRQGLSHLIEGARSNRVRELVSRLNMQDGTRFRSKLTGATYEVRYVRLSDKTVVALNETKNIVVTIGLRRFDEFYEVIQQE